MSRLELKIPPLVLAVITAAAMWVMSVGVEALALDVPHHGRIALVFAALGLGVIVAGAVSFRAAQTTFDPRYPEPASSLVVAGVYRYTRNPMYLGMALALLAWAIFLAHALAALLVAAFIVYMNRFQIGVEERHLQQLFGAEYAAYTNKVRRWI